MSKKIAVCIYGSLRNWDYSKHNILSFFGNDVDYFFVTWDKETNDPSLLYGKSKRGYDLVSLEDNSVYGYRDTSYVVDDFNGYNLKSYSFLNKSSYVSKWIPNVTSMIEMHVVISNIMMQHVRSLVTAEELQRNAEYDVVFMFRWETFIYSYTDFDAEFLLSKANEKWMVNRYSRIDRADMHAPLLKSGDDTFYFASKWQNKIMAHAPHFMLTDSSHSLCGDFRINNYTNKLNILRFDEGIDDRFKISFVPLKCVVDLDYKRYSKIRLPSDAHKFTELYDLNNHFRESFLHRL